MIRFILLVNKKPPLFLTNQRQKQWRYLDGLRVNTLIYITFLKTTLEIATEIATPIPSGISAIELRWQTSKTMNNAIKGACWEAANRLQPPSSAHCQIGMPTYGKMTIPMNAPIAAPIATEGVKVPPKAPARIVKTVTAYFATAPSNNTSRKFLPVVLIENWARARPFPIIWGKLIEIKPVIKESSGSCHKIW